MANVLHFVGDAEAVLARIAAGLRPGGRLVLIEYEGRRPSPWVPYPVPAARFRELAAAAGLTPPEVVATRPSAFGGEMYVATALRAGDATEPDQKGG
jgi:SAM-dependent methyltransferase